MRLVWWQEGVFYQIYPRSFQDSNGDGIGDLEGIIARLDHLNDGTARSLGVDAIWLSPFYRSPMADFGYDVADYTDVDPIFGTVSEFDRLLVEAHRRNIRVIVDLVPGHTSNQHPWFLASRSSRKDPKRDWHLQNQAMVAAFKEKAYDFKHVFGEGAHSDDHGGALLPDMLRWIWRDYPGVQAKTEAKGQPRP